MVKIESGSIEEITPTGIKMDGMAEEFDIIVCATGFDISFCPAWEMIGKDGSRLADQGRESPEAYFGICAPNVPNHFICNGPNCLIGHGSLLAVMDWTANWIVRWCRKIATEDIKAVRVSDSACDDYNVYSQEFLKRTAWASGCKSWYKNGKVDDPGELPSRRLCVRVQEWEKVQIHGQCVHGWGVKGRGCGVLFETVEPDQAVCTFGSNKSR